VREPWRDFSRALAAEAATDAAAALAHLSAPRGVRAADRFEVHRRNRRHALVAALVARHPVSEALVGEDFFKALAAEYVRREPPRSAALLEYGAGFATFLDGFEPARTVSCLADVARVENAWHEAYHSREARPLVLGSLSASAPEELLALRFETHPATRLVSSPHPAGTLWNAHRLGATAAPLARYDAECVIVVRPQAEVHVHVLPIGASAFVESLLAGTPFETAAAIAPPDPDPVALLARLIDMGAFTEHLSC